MTTTALPLVRRRRLRGLIAIGLLAGHLVSLALGYVGLLWLFAPIAFGAICVSLLAAGVAAKVVAGGRWAIGAAGGLQACAVVMLCASYVVLAVLASARGVDAVSSQSAFATPRGETSSGFWVAAIATAALAGVIAAIPLPGGVRLAKVAAVALACVAGAGVGVAAAVAARADACEAFAFDRQRWRAALQRPDVRGSLSDAERIGGAIDRCRTVDGAARATVRRLLGGSPTPSRRTWIWPLGTTNDAIGPGDGQDLHVEFGRSGRARDVYLTYP